MAHSNDKSNNSDEVYDTVIIGGGVVGLAILREATLKGLKCALIEASPHLLSKASGSNSGIACTGVDAEPGTLERALIRDSISRIRPFCKDHNIPMRECGSLVCLWPWDHHHDDHQDNNDGAQNEKLMETARESWEAGDSNTTILDKHQVLAMEPALSSQVEGAVHIPGEIVLDPWLFPIALASHARENGADIFTSFPFSPSDCHFNSETKLWTIHKPESQPQPETDETTHSPLTTLVAKSVINATGIQSDLVQLNTPDVPKPCWEAKPRRGQYRIFSSSKHNNNNDTPILVHPIQPVPTEFTKGIFVFSTLYDQVVVGPTALDQVSRTDTTPDPHVAKQLTQHAQRILGDFDEDNENDNNNKYEYVGEYVGLRPGTNHRDYQIHLIHEKQWISAAGIRSTGLTASLGIGSYVTRLLCSMVQIPTRQSQQPQKHKLTPLPNVSVLANMFRHSQDGTVEINGYAYKVTHPLTKFGWTHGTGLAQS